MQMYLYLIGSVLALSGFGWALNKWPPLNDAVINISKLVIAAIVRLIPIAFVLFPFLLDIAEVKNLAAKAEENLGWPSNDASTLFSSVTIIGSCIGIVLAFAIEQFFSDGRFSKGEKIVTFFLLLCIASCQGLVLYYNYAIHIGAHHVLGSDEIEVYAGHSRFIGGCWMVGLNLVSTMIGAFMPLIIMYVSDLKKYQELKKSRGAAIAAAKAAAAAPVSTPINPSTYSASVTTGGATPATPGTATTASPAAPAPPAVIHTTPSVFTPEVSAYNTFDKYIAKMHTWFGFDPTVFKSFIWEKIGMELSGINNPTFVPNSSMFRPGSINNDAYKAATTDTERFKAALDELKRLSKVLIGNNTSDNGFLALEDYDKQITDEVNKFKTVSPRRTAIAADTSLSQTDRKNKLDDLDIEERNSRTRVDDLINRKEIVKQQFITICDLEGQKIVQTSVPHIEYRKHPCDA